MTAKKSATQEPQRLRITGRRNARRRPTLRVTKKELSHLRPACPCAADWVVGIHVRPQQYLVRHGPSLGAADEVPIPGVWSSDSPENGSTPGFGKLAAAL